MKRKIALILVFLMMLCCVSALASAGQRTPRIPMSLSGSNAIKYSTKSQTGTINNLFSPGESVAQRFTIKENQELTKISLWSASHGDNIGNLTLTLYAWKNDYATSIAGEVLAKKTFVNFPDNSKISMDVSTSHRGTFLLTVTDPTDRVAVYSGPSSNAVNTEDCCFVNRNIREGKCLNMEANVITYETLVIENEPLDPYSPIDLSKPHAHKKMRFSTLTETGEGCATIESGSRTGFLAFKVDFGDVSPKGVALYGKHRVEDAAKVQIIADDLLTGPVIAEFYAESEGLFDSLPTLTSKVVEEITGVHNIFVVCKFTTYNDLAMATLTFLNETPEPDKYEKRLADFNATKDFELIDTYSDTWAGNDLLGRKLVDYETVGEFNPDKQVGMFYWTWSTKRMRRNMNVSVNQRVIDLYMGPESDIKNDYDYKGWHGMGYWNVSVYGFYSCYDEWVLRKQLEMFSAAGVDGIFFDASNGVEIFTGGYMKIADTIHKMHREGTPTPGISFVFPFFSPANNVENLTKAYESMYSHGLYSDAWYYWDGKPVVMAYPDNLVSSAQNEEIKAQQQEMLDFFTFRPGQPDYRKGPSRDNQWPWLEVYPQNPYGKSDKYGCEAVSVGVAQNSSDNGLDAMNGKDIYGRSFTYKDRFKKLSSSSDFYGYNFIEQWDRAFELDPEFVFVTGWNEWDAGHYESWQSTKGAFPDQYSDEYSRDIEPTVGEFKDTYYMLLANKIRQFKGVRPTPTASAEKTIDMSAGFSQWADVGPEFIGFIGGTDHRQSYSIQDMTEITNTTGRNDIILSKVARDSENLYFYVKTAENLTPHTDENWMRLFINTDRKYKTGWEGYDFVLNRANPTESTATLEKWNGKYPTDWEFEKVADVEYTYDRNEMMIKIPKSLVGIGTSIDIEFKWNDNMQEQGDIMDFYTNGDTAPIARFAYRYVDEANVKNKAVDEPVDPALTLPHLTSRFVAMAIGNNKAYAFGNKTTIDPLSEVTAPVIINDKTLVPVRFLAESMGWKVTWTEETQEIRIEDGERRVILQIGSDQMRAEREILTLQTPAMTIENRTYVPLRDIVEGMGINCYWSDPGLILCGAEEGYIEIIVNGGVERIAEEFEFAN